MSLALYRFYVTNADFIESTDITEINMEKIKFLEDILHNPSRLQDYHHNLQKVVERSGILDKLK